MFYYFKAQKSYVNISFIARIFASEEMKEGFSAGAGAEPEGSGKFRVCAIMISNKENPAAPIQISGIVHDTMEGAREECKSVIEEINTGFTEHSTLLN